MMFVDFHRSADRFAFHNHEPEAMNNKVINLCSLTVAFKRDVIENQNVEFLAKRASEKKRHLLFGFVSGGSSCISRARRFLLFNNHRSLKV